MKNLRFFFAVVLCSALLCLGRVQAAYSDATAKNLLFASAAAYCAERNVVNWSCGPCRQLGMKNVQYFHHQPMNIAGYVGVSNVGVFGAETLADLRADAMARNASVNLNEASEVVVVVFRGTQPTSLENWIQNLKFSQVVPVIGGNCPGCGVHQGWQESYNALRARILQMIKDRHRSGAPIVTTGHSLGGALAHLAAWDIKVNQPGLVLSPSKADRDFAAAQVVSYTYGQPRTGNEVFAKTLQKQLVNNYRVVHASDIVAHLPPQLVGFSHMATEVWFRGSGSTCTSSNKCTICSTSNGEDNSCSNSVLNLSIPDHLVYLDQLISGLC